MEYLFLGILFLVCITNFLYRKIKVKGLFDQVFYCYLWVTVAHVSCALIWFYFFTDRTYVDWAAPFGLCYGPLFYFGNRAANAIQINRKEIIIHASPFILFSIAYVLFVSRVEFREVYGTAYFLALYSITSASMVAYCIWGIFEKRIQNPQIHSKNVETYKFLGPVSMVFWVIALLCVVDTYTGFVEGISTSQDSVVVTYSIMLFILGIAFRYTANRLSENNMGMDPAVAIPNEMERDSKSTSTGHYQKSAISESLLDNYEEKLSQKIEEQVYLNPELTLDSLAADLKVTKHHLTQILNFGIGQSFNHYINGYRIEHACKLLSDPRVELTIEDLASECGFNSKSSFNRNFKNRMGCTPSEFRLGVSGVKTLVHSEK